MSKTIIAENICHKFSGRQVLDNVTLSAGKGEIFGLLGPSGAGKTTLIKILTGQLTPDSGYAALLGQDTRKLSPHARRQIGAMMDNFGLYERLSVYNNLAFYADICRVPHKAIPDILRQIGLYESRKTAVSNLSKGMKNRLSLARALLNRPKALFLDEPTAGLDPVTTKEMHRLLTAAKEEGCTIFLTTHNMFEAQSLCDCVALLGQGKIIDSGSPTEICRRYNHLNRLKVSLKDGKCVELENGRTAALPLSQYLDADMVASIHSTEPTLETVFIELTGKGLNENDEYAGNIQETTQRHAEK